MASTTFSGPVTSQAGFITGTDVVAPAVTTATLTLTSALSGRVIPLNRAAGMTITLPAATGSQSVYRFIVSTTFSGNCVIQVANTIDVMVGTASVSSSANSAVFATQSLSDTITMNTTTTGGVSGSYVELTDISSGEWLVRAALLCPAGQTAATPFGSLVS